MQTAQEIEDQLAEAATRMRTVNKAAIDRAAKTGAEPTDVAQPNLGDAIAATPATIQTQR